MRLPPRVPTNSVCGYGTGELQEQRPQHREEAEKFYRELAAQGMQVRVGMEAGGHAHWFERLQLQFANRSHGVPVHRPMCGKVACQKRHRSQEHDDGNDGDGIVGSDSVQ